MNVFVTGATGYIGSRIIPKLLLRGHSVTALVRKGSEHKISANCKVVIGDVLNATTYSNALDGVDTLIHLVGVEHPSPSKVEQFRSIDFQSVVEVIPAAVSAGISHAIYLSVAHPAPIMKEYWQLRAEAEKLFEKNFSHCSFLRPWYVLGPGHRWAYITAPLYSFARLFPSARRTADRLALVTIDQILNTLLYSVENTPQKTAVYEALDIRRL